MAYRTWVDRVLILGRRVVDRAVWVREWHLPHQDRPVQRGVQRRLQSVCRPAGLPLSQRITHVCPCVRHAVPPVCSPQWGRRTWNCIVPPPAGLPQCPAVRKQWFASWISQPEQPPPPM